jgi:ribonuclease Z
MADFEVTILGSSSATPTFTRNPSAQVLQILGRYFLIDCGEGTQIQMRKNRVKFQKINQIFISHLHGDHYLGLMGFIQTLHLLGRTTPLEIFSPSPLKEILEIQLKHSETTLRYPLIFNEIDTTSHLKIWEDNCVEVYSIPLKHRLPCSGFLFKEKEKLLSVRKDMLAEYKIPIASIQAIKEGSDFTTSFGQVIPNYKLVHPKTPLKSYAYCSDTIFDPTIVPLISEVNLLYHESTFINEHSTRAKETFHSTAEQAATIAKMANVKKLLLGHFSARYGNLDIFIQEALPHFQNVETVEEGKTYLI